MSNEKRKKALVSVEQKFEAVQRLDKDKTAKKWLRLQFWLLLLVIASRKEGKLVGVLPELKCETLYIKNNAHKLVESEIRESSDNLPYYYFTQVVVSWFTTECLS